MGFNTEKSGRDAKVSLFNKIIEENKSKVYGIAYGFTNHREDSQDIVQEVFRKAWENFSQVRDESKRKSWLISIAYNTCKNFVKRKKDFEDLPEEYAQKSEENILRDRILNEIGKLDCDKRIALILLEYEGYSYREIANVMGKSESSVKTIIFRARNDLKLLLRDLSAAEEK